jgi:peptidyl-dipeptidase A
MCRATRPTRATSCADLPVPVHRAACQQAGWTGPLHRCSIYGNKAVGEKFNAMLEMGQSRPSPEALAAFTGQRETDASAMTAYFSRSTSG